MATTTPNYGWDVPTSTDYVKDGATAIETLGDDIDATVWSITNGKSVALSTIVSTTFSATTTISADSVFTSSFKNYRIIVNTTSGSGSPAEIQMRFRTSGVANSSALYNMGSNATYAFALRTAGGPFTGVIDLMQPQQAQATFYTINYSDSAQAGGRGGFFNGTTQFDGIQFINSGGTNMTGTIQILGYRD